MKEPKSDAVETSPEETAPSNIGNVFDDEQPMTYENPEQDDYPETSDDTIYTYEDPKQGASEESDDDEQLPASVRAYRELQSQADKDAKAVKDLQAKLEAQQSLVEEYQLYKPIVEHLEKHPEIIDRLASGDFGTPSQSQEAAQVEEELKPPVMPSGYDKFAAYNDPESDSFKYREAYDDYKIRYMEKLAANVEKAKTDYETKVQQDMRTRQEQAAYEQLNVALARDFQMGEKERADFIAFSQNPKPDLGTLVKLFRENNTKPEVKNDPPPKGQNFRTIADAGGDGTPPPDGNKQFVTSLKGKTRNLFETL